ncbi:MAG: CerR family C-terminal domain-containing protein [Thermodesulfobacteriota bacterium]|nr:CerR family C-terminal domain-containing protein [Thermodesulfobacteriota bacterium]
MENISTRERILTSAIEVFGEHGYKAATVREICKRASVGIASVNYYFHDKEGLYLEVYRAIITSAIQAFPTDMGLGADPGPEQRLHAFIRSLLYRLPMIAGSHNSMLVREMLDPSPSLADLHMELVKPLKEILSSIVVVLLGPGALINEIELCMSSIVGQCLFYNPHAVRVRQSFQEGDSAGKDIEAISRHITAFSLAGIYAVRDRHHAEGEVHVE